MEVLLLPLAVLLGIPLALAFLAQLDRSAPGEPARPDLPAGLPEATRVRLRRGRLGWPPSSEWAASVPLGATLRRPLPVAIYPNLGRTHVLPQSPTSARLAGKFVASVGGEPAPLPGAPDSLLGRLFASGELEPVLDALFAAGVESVRSDFVELVATGRRARDRDAVAEALEDLAPLFRSQTATVRLVSADAAPVDGEVEAAPELPAGSAPVPASAPAGPRCPYCLDALGDLEVAACAVCGTAHHAVCFAEVGGCTVLGCRARPARQPSRERA